MALDDVDRVDLRGSGPHALLVYTFARLSAALVMTVEDYYPRGKRRWVRLHETGGKQHEMPVHHLLEHDLDAYLTALRGAAGSASGGELAKDALLFQTPRERH